MLQERIGSKLSVSDALGFALMLAERLHYKVLIVYNDEHLTAKQAEAGTYFDLYRERAISHRYHLTPSMGVVLSRVANDRYPDLPGDHKDRVLSHLVRINCKNLRTLFRCLYHVDEASRIAGQHFSASHAAFLIALTVSDSEGNLQHREFYEFNEFLVAIYGAGSSQDKDQTQLEQIAFYNRHYPPGSPDYRFSHSLYLLVREGAFDRAAFEAEVAQTTLALASPAETLISEWESRAVLYYSDEEHINWTSRVKDLLFSDEAATGLEVLRMLQGVLASHRQLEEDVPSEFWDAAQYQLIAAARRQDTSLTNHARIFERDPKVQALLETHDLEVDRVARDKLAEEMLEAVWELDAATLISLTGSRPPLSIDVALDQAVLSELHATRKKSRRFYFEVLLDIREAARQFCADAATTRLAEYVAVCLWLEPDLDRSDKHRFFALLN